MCSRFFLLLVLILLGSNTTSGDLELPPTSSDFVILSDGSDLKLQSRSGHKTSSLGINKRVISLDNLFVNDTFVSIFWIEEDKDSKVRSVHVSDVDIKSLKTVRHEHIVSPFLSNITSISAVRADEEVVILTSHDDGKSSGRLVVTRLGLGRECIWLEEATKPGHLVTGTQASQLYVFWIANKTCVEAVFDGVHIQRVVCIHDLLGNSSQEFGSIKFFDGQLYLLVSNGQLFHGEVQGHQFSEISSHEYKSALEMDHSYNRLDIISKGQVQEIYVSNKLEGTLLQVILNKEMKALKTSVLAVENSIVDFQLISTGSKSQVSFNACSAMTSSPDNGEEFIIELILPEVNNGVDLRWEYVVPPLIIMALCLGFFLSGRGRRVSSAMPRFERNISEEPVISVSADKCISIEDLGGFVNPGFSGKGNVRSACDSCDYKGECSERGFCMNTYRLLT